MYTGLASLAEFGKVFSPNKSESVLVDRFLMMRTKEHAYKPCSFCFRKEDGMIQGLSHITLIVSDIEHTATLFQKVFDAEEVYDSGAETFSLAREKFMLVGGIWLCLMEGAALPETTYNHIAFSVEEQDLDAYAQRLLSAGAVIKKDRPRVNGEGRSLYFYDYDNHLFELHAGSLGDRLKRYAQGNP